MRCPFCGHAGSKVLDSRPTEDGNSIRRRRECLECTRRYTTYEKAEMLPLLVVKKDGRREVYNRQKLLGGLTRACEKRPIPVGRLEEMVYDIERELMNTTEREVKSEAIGELVMDRLRQVDEVAYVRFASVYRQFKDLESFMAEVKAMLKVRE
ncbi:NrdR family transcriptional regulator [Clostridiales bacterium PH28_bin88]|nr:NrdR family transcriptional regulator [Clostridiales bacterium PH28_bin88]